MEAVEAVGFSASASASIDFAFTASASASIDFKGKSRTLQNLGFSMLRKSSVDTSVYDEGLFKGVVA